MRIAVTGSKGQLGRSLQAELQGHELLLIDLPEYDFTDPGIVEVIADFQPEVVIHAGAYTNVDKAEREPETCYRVNVFGTHNVALACQRCGAVLVHISTNEVFDGTSHKPYLEYDRPNPISTYARSKWMAEQVVRDLVQRFYIVRTAWLYAQGGTNFPSKIMAAADKHGRLRVVRDEFGSPTYAPDLAQAIHQLIQTGHYGVYHFTNEGACSRYEFALKILELSGRGHIPVEPITSDQWERAAKPPLRAVIHNFLGAALGIRLRPWEEALEDYFGLGGHS